MHLLLALINKVKNIFAASQVSNFIERTEEEEWRGVAHLLPVHTCSHSVDWIEISFTDSRPRESLEKPSTLF